MTATPMPGHTAKLVSRAGFRWAMQQTKNRTDGGVDCSSIPKLAQAVGMSYSSIGFLWTDGKSARDTCSLDLARKIAEVSGAPFDSLFVIVPKSEARKATAA